MQADPAPRPPKPPSDRERFVFRILAVVIGTQLLLYSLAAGVCGQQALEGRPVGQICPGTLEQMQGGFDTTLKLLLALLGGAALTRMPWRQAPGGLAQCRRSMRSWTNAKPTTATRDRSDGSRKRRNASLLTSLF
jgi:hypothetical protein